MRATGRHASQSPVATSISANPRANQLRGSNDVAAAPSSAGGIAAPMRSAATGRSKRRRRAAARLELALAMATPLSVAVVISSGCASE